MMLCIGKFKKYDRWSHTCVQCLYFWMLQWFKLYRYIHRYNTYIHNLFFIQSMGHTVTHLGHVYRHHLARIALPFAVAVGARLVAINQMSWWWACRVVGARLVAIKQMSWWWAWRVMGFLSDASSLFRALIMVVLFRLMFPLPWKRWFRRRALPARFARAPSITIPELPNRFWHFAQSPWDTI